MAEEFEPQFQRDLSSIFDSDDLEDDDLNPRNGLTALQDDDDYLSHASQDVFPKNYSGYGSQTIHVEDDQSQPRYRARAFEQDGLGEGAAFIHGSGTIPIQYASRKETNLRTGDAALQVVGVELSGDPDVLKPLPSSAGRQTKRQRQDSSASIMVSKRQKMDCTVEQVIWDPDEVRLSYKPDRVKHRWVSNKDAWRGPAE